MEIIVGTYEELILSYKFTSQDKVKFEQSFTDHSHTGNVKSVAISSKGVLASGSSDETVRLFNLITRREIGRLMHHEGSITSLQFFGKKHLFSSSEDGTVGVWQVGRWECLRTLKGHKGFVNSVSVHPSGKLALSVSKDKTLRTWNLLTAKCAYVSNIKTEADIVTWSPGGELYLLVINNRVDIYNVETSSITNQISLDTRINVIKFIKNNFVILAGEGGEVFIYDINTAAKVYQFSTDSNRIKGLEVIQCDGNDWWLVTGSSQGLVKIWKLNISKWETQLVISHDTKFRITCLAAVTLSSDDHKAEETAPECVKEEVAEEEEDEDEEVVHPKKKKKKDGKRRKSDSPADNADQPSDKGKISPETKKKNVSFKNKVTDLPSKKASSKESLKRKRKKLM